MSNSLLSVIAYIPAHNTDRHHNVIVYKFWLCNPLIYRVFPWHIVALEFLQFHQRSRNLILWKWTVGESHHISWSTMRDALELKQIITIVTRDCEGVKLFFTVNQSKPTIFVFTISSPTIERHKFWLFSFRIGLKLNLHSFSYEMKRDIIASGHSTRNHIHTFLRFHSWLSFIFHFNVHSCFVSSSFSHYADLIRDVFFYSFISLTLCFVYHHQHCLITFRLISHFHRAPLSFHHI